MRLLLILVCLTQLVPHAYAIKVLKATKKRAIISMDGEDLQVKEVIAIMRMGKKVGLAKVLKVKGDKAMLVTNTLMKQGDSIKRRKSQKKVTQKKNQTSQNSKKQTVAEGPTEPKPPLRHYIGGNLHMSSGFGVGLEYGNNLLGNIRTYLYAGNYTHVEDVIQRSAYDFGLGLDYNVLGNGPYANGIFLTFALGYSMASYSADNTEETTLNETFFLIGASYEYFFMDNASIALGLMSKNYQFTEEVTYTLTGSSVESTVENEFQNTFGVFGTLKYIF